VNTNIALDKDLCILSEQKAAEMIIKRTIEPDKQYSKKILKHYLSIFDIFQKLVSSEWIRSILSFDSESETFTYYDKVYFVEQILNCFSRERSITYKATETDISTRSYSSLLFQYKKILEETNSSVPTTLIKEREESAISLYKLLQSYFQHSKSLSEYLLLQLAKDIGSRVAMRYCIFLCRKSRDTSYYKTLDSIISDGWNNLCEYDKYLLGIQQSILSYGGYKNTAHTIRNVLYKRDVLSFGRNTTDTLLYIGAAEKLIQLSSDSCISNDSLTMQISLIRQMGNDVPVPASAKWISSLLVYVGSQVFRNETYSQVGDIVKQLKSDHWEQYFDYVRKDNFVRLLWNKSSENLKDAWNSMFLSSIKKSGLDYSYESFLNRLVSQGIFMNAPDQVTIQTAIVSKKENSNHIDTST